MRRRPPPEVDPDRLRSLLASARPRPESRPGGWVPTEAPAAVEETIVDEAPSSATTAGPSWIDDRAAEEESAAIGGRHRSPPRVLTVPVAFRGARVAVSARALVAFVVVLVVAVLFFAARVARASSAAAPQRVPAGEGVVGRSSVPSAFVSSGPLGSSGSVESSGVGATSVTVPTARGSPGRLVVDVVGQVARPGVVTVPEGSRVIDVLAAAGGALAGADVQRLNLARLVADGEQLFVPKPGETPPVLIGALDGSGTGVVGTGGSGPGAGGTANGLVDLNTATLAALDTLPGVGPVLAQRILDWRSQHGRFSSVDELGEVSGIGDKLLEQIRPKVRV